jgi:hypothetical protein
MSLTAMNPALQKKGIHRVRREADLSVGRRRGEPEFCTFGAEALLRARAEAA